MQYLKGRSSKKLQEEFPHFIREYWRQHMWATGYLLKSLVLHVDETPIKINLEQYYIHNISNHQYTLQYVHSKRGEKEIKDFGLLKDFHGILVHDYFRMYYNYGAGNFKCNVHALRYLKGVTDFTNHQWAKKLFNLLIEMKARKEELLEAQIDRISDAEYEEYKRRYLSIVEEGKLEYKSDLKTNSYKKDERRLLTRLEKYVDNHLLFMKKFYVPFSNNRAEADLRFAKIRQKIGKSSNKFYRNKKFYIHMFQK